MIGGAAARAAVAPVDCVNPLSGTNGDSNFSRGNTIPASTLPFGMTTWSPQTDGSTSSFYTMKERRFEGMRATHQPSIWIRDYGDFTVMPVVGGTAGSSRELASAFTHEKEMALPYYYAATLDRYQTRVELAPSERCAAMQFAFPETEQAAVVFRNPKGEVASAADAGRQRVTGAARHVAFGAPGNFAIYFAAEFDQPFTAQAARTTKDGNTLAVHLPGMKAGVPLRMRIGTSFISYEQAEANLRREVPDWNFDAVKERAKAAWAHALAVVDIEGGERRAAVNVLHGAVPGVAVPAHVPRAGRTRGRCRRGTCSTPSGFIRSAPAIQFTCWAVRCSRAPRCTWRTARRSRCGRTATRRAAGTSRRDGARAGVRAAVAQGGTLELEMGAQPNPRWASGVADAPPNDLP